MEDNLLETSVLIVDDSSLNIRVISNIISPLGYRVFSAKSGEQALTFLTKRRPSMIIMDLKMPNMDGFECCARIKKIQNSATIPILILSGSNDLHDIHKAQSLGTSGYLTKPVNPEVLIEQLKIYSPFAELS